MKTIPHSSACKRVVPSTLFFLFVTGLGLLSPPAANAQLYWYGNGSTLGGDGTWSETGGTQWSQNLTGGGTGSWVNHSVAAFRGTSGTVTVSGTVRALSLDLSNTGTSSGSWNFAGGADATIELSGSGGLISRGSAGGLNNFNVVFSGTQGLTLNGNGTWNFNGPSSTYLGNTSFSSNIRLIGLNVLPTTTIVTTAGTLDIRGNQQFSGLAGSGNVTVGTGGTKTLHLSSTSATPVLFTGTFVQNANPANVLNLEKSGSYEQQITGSTASTSHGTVLINGGVLALGKTAGLNALGSGSGAITIQSGSLRLDQNDQLADTQSLILSGGTLDMNGKSEELGVLDLNANSALTLGIGGVVAFAGSAGLDWGAFTITVNGNLNATSIRFGSAATGISTTQLANFRFADYGNVAAQIDNLGYVTPVPEPTSAGLLIGATLAFGALKTRACSRRKRQQ